MHLSEAVYIYIHILLLQIVNSTGTDDFVSLSVPGQFLNGETSSTCTFTVVNDNTPEGNETFLVQIGIQSGSATIGTNNTAYLTIASNDDPYGIIQFQNVCILFILLTFIG